MLAGDLNQLQDSDVIECNCLTQIVRQPTRGDNILDRIFVSSPLIYPVVRVLSSVVKTDHKAVVAMSAAECRIHKTRERRTFRSKTPSQNARFLQHLSTLDFSERPPLDDLEPQSAFNSFYTLSLGLLNDFYPERTVTVTSRDPSYKTAEIKTKLRR